MAAPEMKSAVSDCISFSI